MPPPIMRTLIRALSGWADDVLLNEDRVRSHEALNIRGPILRVADKGMIKRVYGCWETCSKGTYFQTCQGRFRVPFPSDFWLKSEDSGRESDR